MISWWSLILHCLRENKRTNILYEQTVLKMNMIWIYKWLINENGGSSNGNIKIIWPLWESKSTRLFNIKMFGFPILSHEFSFHFQIFSCSMFKCTAPSFGGMLAFLSFFDIAKVILWEHLLGGQLQCCKSLMPQSI